MATKSVSRRAAAYIVFVCVLLIGIDGWRSWNARSSQLREMDAVASNLAHAVAQQADDTFRHADAIIAGVVERVETDGTAPKAIDRLNRLLGRIAAELPEMEGMSVYDANGDRVATSQRDAGVPGELRVDREYFVFHRNNADRGAHIGVPVQSRTTGKWVIPVTRRINGEDGQFEGVVLAAIDVDFFRRCYDTLDIGDDGAIGLILNNGTLLVRRPFRQEFVGADMTKSELFRARQELGPVGSLFIKSSKDGVVRLNSYRSLDRYPVFAAAALSKNEILGDWWHDTLLHTGGVALLVLLAGLIGSRLVQQIRLRSHAEMELIAVRDELMQLNRKLERLAMSDALTGLANRRLFDNGLAAEFARARRASKPLALVMLDVDLFKQYNDTYGHAAGDECLRLISNVIKETVGRRSGDIVARYGGEEIAILLPETNMAGAVAVAEKIRWAVRGLHVPHARNAPGLVTVSLGVEAFDPVKASDSPEYLIMSADKALYMAKAQGRDRVCTRAVEVGTS